MVTGGASAQPVRCVDGRVPAEADYPTRADISSIFRDWFSASLTHLREPPLTCADDGAEVYRLVWLRSFEGAITVRITITDDKVVVTARMAAVPIMSILDTPNGMDRTLREEAELLRKRLEKDEIKETSVALDRESVTALRQAVADASYWDMPTPEPPDPPGYYNPRFDGAQWIVEGIRDGRYHVVDRWSPAPGAYRDLALLMRTLGGVEVPPAEDY
ncbi:hypothetical protein [Zavarzinia aquatilis]|nr:hypothetical protein [Zavarzinia aquatilis]